ncbi:MAG: FliA/WhiG family RNA polymerase sigma factor [Acidobacteria bacterium]|nr:FliA/WhiG family RNA polymerase sigma factor [Acidobacteriota bacterium]MBI3662997.1 FliA/WhiG family RNA polymerase sigma factor [Acidobacteriota bacterium]
MKQAHNAYETIGQMDTAERDRLLMEQLPQVRHIARRIHDRLPRHVPLEDLIQAGILGLIDALHKYDPGKHVQLGYYARFRIHGAIMDSLRQLDWSPRELRKQARRVEQADRKIRGRFGRAASDIELAEELGLKLGEFQHLLAELRGLDIGSLQVETAEEAGGEELLNYLPNYPADDPFYRCHTEEMKQVLARAISELPAKDRQVLALYYFEELNMKEVGAVLNVSESRVSQIHSAAVIRLRARLQELLGSRPSNSNARRATAGAKGGESWKKS